jgi:hypothetical protein
VFTPFDTAPKKYTNAGLREKVVIKKMAKASEFIDLFQSGGLNEEDANATCPSFEPKPEPECDPTRKRNNVCDIRSIFT